MRTRFNAEYIHGTAGTGATPGRGRGRWLGCGSGCTTPGRGQPAHRSRQRTIETTEGDAASARRRRGLRPGGLRAGPQPHRAAATPWPSSTAAGGLQPPAGDFSGQTIVGHRLRPRSAARRPASSRPTRRRRRHERRQLQHPHRPRRPRDVRHRARRRPHLRPPPGRDLPAPRHRHRRDRGVDDRAGAAPDPARRARGRVGRPERQGVAGRADVAGAWSGRRRCPSSRSRARCGSWRSAAWASAQVPTCRPGRPGGRRRLPDRGRRRARRRRRRCWPGRPREGTDASRHRRRRQRRAVHRRAAARDRARGAHHGQRPGRRARGPAVARAGGRAVAPGRRLRGRPSWPRRRSTRPTSSPRSPATTRTTSSSRCWPSRSSACPASSPA